MKVGQRRNMLNYLAKKDVAKYREVVKKLGLRKYNSNTVQSSFLYKEKKKKISYVH